MTPRISPKTGSSYGPSQQIRIELPAQGYMNAGNSALEFDVYLTGYGTSAGEITRFQNNIQSLFSRVRILYGATPLEDIINYNVIIRCLTEWTGTGQQGVMDQASVANGIGGVSMGSDTAGRLGFNNVRQKQIQGISSTTAGGSAADFLYGVGGRTPNEFATGVAPFSQATTTGQYTCVRRYQVYLGTGLFTQEKLVSFFLANSI